MLILVSCPLGIKDTAYTSRQFIVEDILSFNFKVESWGNHLAGNLYNIGNPIEYYTHLVLIHSISVDTQRADCP